MKSIATILFFLLAWVPAVLQAQGIGQEEFEKYMLLVKDLDDDLVNDTVYFDYDNSVVVCKLSSQNFESVRSQTIDHYVVVRNSEPGFSIRFGSFVASWISQFRYEPETQKIRLTEISQSLHAESFLYGTSCINLLTNEYVGHWTYFDENEDEIKLPTIETSMPFPETYLGGFGENTCYAYTQKSQELIDSHKEKKESGKYLSPSEKVSQPL